MYFSEKLKTVDVKVLKEAIAALNKTEGNEMVIKITGTNIKNMVNDLTMVVEEMNSTEPPLDIPEIAADFFNGFWEGTTDDPEPTPAAGKKTVVKKKSTKPVTKKEAPSNAKKEEPKPKKETSIPKALLQVRFLNKLLKKCCDKKTIIDALNLEFSDSLNEARYQAAIALNLLTTFGSVVKKDGKFKST